MKNMNLPPIESLSQEVQDELQSLPKINLYRKLAVLQKSFIPLIDTFKSFYIEESKIPHKLREIGILRVGSNTDSAYELHHHKLISKSTGLTKDETNIIINEKHVTQLNEIENTVCRVVDEFCKNFSLTEETQEKLYSLIPSESAMELILCIGIYIGLACFLKGTDVQIEPTNPLEGKSTPV